MTRAEELEKKQERNRREYEQRLDRKRKQSRQWYWQNRDYALARLRPPDSANAKRRA